MPKRTPTMRMRLDGRCWKVKLHKPPGKNLDGLCDFTDRIIYIDPTAVASGRGIELAAHEATHARCWDLDETCVEDIGVATSQICAFLAKHNGGIVT